MLASNPATILNQSAPDLGIPNRFSPEQSCSNDWTKRYPWIAESALKNRIKHFVIDGEAVVLGELR